jgi:hypothetical protein
MMKLLSRADFKAAVFARSKDKCIVCTNPAVDAHHLMERKLFTDGGYYVDNGVALCASCHLKAEYTTISPAQLRTAATITAVVLPPGFDPDLEYDKWGNIINQDGSRAPGPLFEEPSVRTALTRGHAIALFV